MPVSTRADNSITELTTKASNGDMNAQNELAVHYQNGDSVGVPRNLAKAFDLYQKASESGLAVAQYNLAFMYDMGLGVEKDQKTANEWYHKSADQGYAPAMLNLGMNIAGGEGTNQDLVEGMKWIDLARFFTQHEQDMQVKWHIRGAYDYLQQRMSPAQFEEAERRTKTWYEAFSARQKQS
jgi:hypothetical protein